MSTPRAETVISMDTKITVTALLAVAAFGYYLHSDLMKELRRVEQVVCAPSPNMVPLAAGLTQNHASLAGSHTYFELLLEGIARRNDLPLDSARAAWAKEVKTKPNGWHWLPEWEGSKTAPSPRTPKAAGSSVPASPPGVPKSGDIFDDR